MAKLSYDMLQDSQNTPRNSSSTRVGFFSLKDDGDEAIVRFLYDSVEEFEIFSVHSVYVDGKLRKVSCLRSPKDPIDDCPLCKDEQPLQQRIYVRLIQYVKDDNGDIVALPKIWERSKGFVQTLKSLLDEYGPLTESLFKVKRSGKAGTKETTYNTFYCSPMVYKPELYPNKEELFNGYKVLGGIVMDKTFEEMQHYVDEGEFPARKQENKPKVQTQSTVREAFADVKPISKDEDTLPPWEEPKNVVVDESKVERGGDLNSTWVRVREPQQQVSEQPQQQSYRPVRRNYY